MATSRLTEKDVRMFLMDKPELNSLLRGVRWSPEEVESALLFVVGYYNESAPATGENYTVESFPFQFTLLTGVTGHLLKSAAINEASNNISYQLDGVSVNDKDKADVFVKMGSMYWDEFKVMVTNNKLAKNIANAFGSHPSEWSSLHR